MKLLSQRLRAAIEYLSDFGTEASPLVFRPIGDSEVVLSVAGDSYAEYRCQTERPLQERFAVPLRMPARLAKTIDDDLVVGLQLGSHLNMRVDRNEFTSPLFDLKLLPDPPQVTGGVSFEWNASILVPELRTAMAATMSPRGQGGPMESISIEVLPARETIVGSDGRMLSFYEAKANRKNNIRRDDEVDARLLLHRSTAHLVLSTCKSMGLVGIECGPSKLKVECGRRTAILPIQDGAFPVWRPAVFSYLELPAIGKVSLDVRDFLQALRQVKPEADITGAVTLTGRPFELELAARSEDRTSMSQSAIEIEKRSVTFGPVHVSAKYLMTIARNWPEERPFVLEYRGPGCPLIFSRPRFRTVLMPLLDEEKDRHAKTVPSVASTL